MFTAGLVVRVVVSIIVAGVWYEIEDIDHIDWDYVGVSFGWPVFVIVGVLFVAFSALLWLGRGPAKLVKFGMARRIERIESRSIPKARVV